MQHDHSHRHEHGHSHQPPHSHDHDHPHDHHHDTSSACNTGCAAVALEFTPLAASTQVGDGVRTAMRIRQMDCPTEEALIRSQLETMDGVSSLDFNLMQRVLTVVHTPGALPAILTAIRALGFEPELPEADGKLASGTDEHKSHWPLAVAGLAALAAEVAHWIELPTLFPALLALVAIGLSGTGTYRKGWIAIRHGQLNINALMSIAVTGAMALGQWPEAAMVMVLFTLAEVIEARSLDRARNAIAGLMKLAPDTATVQQVDGNWAEVEAAQVAIGSLVRIRPGERIALDGVIVDGQSTIDQAPITGESLPVEKAPGDMVYAGTINQTGSFSYRVTATAGNTTLARIIHAVEAAQGARAPTQRFVNRFARIYTPIVIVIALAVALLPPLLLGGAWQEWIYKALVLLVIACPCALVISTPVSIVSGLAAAARRGILIKGGVHLEEGRKLQWLALDKTGTITHGQPRQTDFAPLAALEAERCQALALRLARRSDHPVSQAIVAASTLPAADESAVDAFTALPGRGVRGEIDGQTYWLGNHRLIHELGRCSPALEARLEILERAGKTVVLLCDEQAALALFAVADTVKDSSRAAISALHGLGIKTLMLSGDNVHTAAAIAAEVGIDEVRGDLLPEDKLAVISELANHGSVGMVGDGINDAPALARADIGFAMGAMGTDTAIETADIALMDDDLGKIPDFIRLSHSTHAVLVQNISLALGIKAVFLLLTLAGLGTMWMAVFADVGASLLVVGNGLRLLRK